jgi:predicted MFS family arabinose efflux permease
MAMVLYEPAFAVIARWFREDRDRAVLALTVVAGFASTVYLPLAGWLVDARGWRDALVILAVILAALTIAPHALVLRRRPEDLGLEPDGARPSERERSVPAGAALRDALFWWLTAAFFLGTLPVAAIGVHLVSYLVDLGHDPAFAATATGLLGAMSVTGRVIVTFLSRCLPQAWVTAFVFVLQAVALLLLPLWHDRLGVLAFVALFGLGFGVVTITRASLVARHYGVGHYGTIGGVSAAFVIGARAAAPAGAGVMYATSGGYGALFVVLSVALVMAALAMVIGCSSAGSRKQALEADLRDRAEERRHDRYGEEQRGPRC